LAFLDVNLGYLAGGLGRDVDLLPRLERPRISERLRDRLFGDPGHFDRGRDGRGLLGLRRFISAAAGREESD